MLDIKSLKNRIKELAIEQKANKLARKTGPNPPPPYTWVGDPDCKIIYSPSMSATIAHSRNRLEISVLLDLYHEARNTRFFQDNRTHEPLLRGPTSRDRKIFRELKDKLRNQFSMVESDALPTP